jgi:hypothetical protein
MRVWAAPGFRRRTSGKFAEVLLGESGILSVMCRNWDCGWCAPVTACEILRRQHHGVGHGPPQCFGLAGGCPQSPHADRCMTTTPRRTGRHQCCPPPKPPATSRRRSRIGSRNGCGGTTSGASDSRKYNDEFNNIRLRTFNGDHLTLPGASPTIQLRPHQRASVWRILQTPNCLLAHVVGAGKTYTMVAAAMELKRLGFARKPLFVVPNHMLGQFSSELLTLYPGANILVAAKDDFEKENRPQDVDEPDRHGQLGCRDRDPFRV